MAVENPPLYLAAGSHSAELDRRAHRALIGGTEGVCGTTDLAVTQRGAGVNMSVDVATGDAWVHGDEGTYQGSYFIENRGALNVAISAAHATLGRRDLIVARVRDAAYSGVTNAAAVEVVTGTASGSPVDPTIPSNAIALARVTVAAAATTITNAVITDMRTRSGGSGGGGITVCTSVTRPAVPFTGMTIYETDTQRQYIWNGSGWAHVAAGRVGWQLRKNSATSLTGAGAVEIAWDTENEDTDGFHSASNAYVQIPSGLGGVYVVTFHLAATGLTSGQLILRRNTFAQVRKAFAAPMDSITWVGYLDPTAILSCAVYNGVSTQNDTPETTGSTVAPLAPSFVGYKVG